MPADHDNLAFAPKPLRHAPMRHGSVMPGLVLALSIVGTFVIAAWVARPGYLQAQSHAPAVSVAKIQRHQQIIESIAAVIAGSSDVLAVHPRGPSPFAEIVLRMHASDDLIARDEIAVISHSRILQTITLYTLDRAAAKGGERIMYADRSSLTGPGFCDRWRGDPTVTPRVLATGIWDMELSPTPDGELLRFALTWASDSADGMDEASVLIEGLDLSVAPSAR